MTAQLRPTGTPPRPVSPLGRSPGDSFGPVVRTAGWRALRTTLQALAAALAGSALGPAVLSQTYWKSLELAAIVAVLAGVASFLHNVAYFLPEDPTQADRPSRDK